MSREKPRFAEGKPDVECQVLIAAPAQRVWEVWMRVHDWHLWDPDTAEAALDGPAAEGTTGRLRPARGRPVPMVLARVEPGRRLAVRCPVLGSALHFDHVVEDTPQGALATHRATFTGWLGPVLRATVGRQVRRGLPVTLQRLKRFVEEGR